jgi:hypothetical protein
MNPSLIITPNAYKAGKLYSIVPTNGAGDLDVVRATSATRVNENGLIEEVGLNVPRLDYSNGSCPSILVEPQRTNYFTNSFDVDSSDWSKSNVIKNGNSTTEIIQGVIGKRYDPIGTSVFPSITRSGAFASSINGQITYYIIVEYSGWKWIELTTTQSTPIERVWFDLENGIKGTDVNNVGNIVKLKNNCYLLSHTTKSRANGATGTIFFSFRQSDNSTGAISGNGTGITFHACQFEAGSNATSYIPTIASTVTRNADVISKTGISDLIGQTEGSIYAEVNISELGSGTKNICQLSIDSSNRFGIQDTGTSTRVLVLSNQFTATFFSFTRLTLGVNKICLIYQNGIWKIFRNGVLAGQQANGIYTSPLTTINVGAGGSPISPSGFLNGGINELVFYKTSLTDAQAIQLTTL